MSARSCRHSKAAPDAVRGFSLLEVLVVVVVAAILAVTLTLAIAGNAQRSLDDGAEQFAALLTQACDEAQLGGREIGVLLDGRGYAFARLDGDRWRTLGGQGTLRARVWPTSLRAALERDGQVLDLGGAVARRPQLVCFSSGELTPFTLTLSLGDPPLQRRVVGTANGLVSLPP